MNTLLSPFRPSAAGSTLKPGVPFSTRLTFGAAPVRPTAVLGNRAFLRAWAARRIASGTASAGRARSA